MMNMDVDNFEIKHPHMCEQILGQLAKDTGYDLLPDLLSIFISDIEQRHIAMSSCGRQGSQWWQLQLHPLKSTSATYGALKLNYLTKNLESVCKQQIELPYCQGDVFNSLVEGLLKELKTVLSHYQHCLEKVKNDPSAVYNNIATN